jgi:hypothetical protein
VGDLDCLCACEASEPVVWFSNMDGVGATIGDELENREASTIRTQA